MDLIKKVNNSLMLTANKNKQDISLKLFGKSFATIAVITLIHTANPHWLPDASINFAKKYVEGQTDISSLKLFISIVLILSGLLAFLIAEKKRHAGKVIADWLRTVLAIFQVTGGAFFGWGVGLFIYILATKRFDQVKYALLALSYLVLFVFYPILIAKEAIEWHVSGKSRNFKKSIRIQKSLFLVIMILGGIMLFGIIFLGW